MKEYIMPEVQVTKVAMECTIMSEIGGASGDKMDVVNGEW